MTMSTTSLQKTGIEAWEGEGGSVTAAPPPVRVVLTGTPAQVEWAERIRVLVDAEFDRVAAAFAAVAETQPAPKRAETEAIIAILEDKRAEVMSGESAGYFIHDWQEIGDQVRQLIFKDPLYKTIRNTWRTQ